MVVLALVASTGSRLGFVSGAVHAWGDPTARPTGLSRPFPGVRTRRSGALSKNKPKSLNPMILGRNMKRVGALPRMLIFSLSREFHSQVDPNPLVIMRIITKIRNISVLGKSLYVIFLSSDCSTTRDPIPDCGDGRCGRRPGECGPTRLPRRCSAPGASNLGGRASVSVLHLFGPAAKACALG